MVRALLDGSKTQTRRPVKLRSKTLIYDLSGAWCDGAANSQYLHVPYHHKDDVPGDSTSERVSCPYGAIGDQLWVRESLRFVAAGENPHEHAVYAADGVRVRRDPGLAGWCCDGMAYGLARSVPSIHMPRWASRITLEIVSVRIERLQDISEDDAIAEGVDGPMCAAAVGRAPSRFNLLPAAVHGYSHLWESLNGARSWDANPWVWAVEFHKVAP